MVKYTEKNTYLHLYDLKTETWYKAIYQEVEQYVNM